MGKYNIIPLLTERAQILTSTNVLNKPHTKLLKTGQIGLHFTPRFGKHEGMSQKANTNN